MKAKRKLGVNRTDQARFLIDLVRRHFAGFGVGDSTDTKLWFQVYVFARQPDISEELEHSLTTFKNEIGCLLLDEIRGSQC